MAQIFRTPLFTTTTYPGRLRAEPAPPNLLVTTLAVVGTAPFSQTDWPPFVRVPVRLAPTETPNLLVTTLTEATVFRVALLAPPPAPRQLRVEAIPNLLTTTLAVVSAAPFAQTDWPLPARPPALRVESFPNPLDTTLRARTTPFSQTEWPIPARVQLRGPVEGPPNLLTVTLWPGTPFTQMDWPVYSRPQGRLETPPPSLLTTTLTPVTTAPFTQTDWPLLARPAQRYASDVTLNLLTGSLARPFQPLEWTIYQLRLARYATDPPPNLLSSTIAPAVVAAPFYQTAWPLTPPHLLYQHDFISNLLPLQTAPPLVLIHRDRFTLGTVESMAIDADPALGGRGSF